MKKHAWATLALVAAMAMGTTARAADVAAEQDARLWFYGNYTAAFTPNWSFTVMPGVRFELARWGKDGLPEAKYNYMYELFAGPNYLRRFGDLTVKGSVWYYYTGYPLRKEAISATATDDKYYASHHVEVIPSVDYKIGRFSIMDRVILHNTVYSDYSAYTTSSQKNGYGLVLRELVQARFAINDRLGISVGDEPFFGLIEDSGTKNLVDANGAKIGYHPYGYWRQGLRLNRIYLGVDYKVLPTLLVSPMYVFETNMNPKDSYDVASNAHYLFVTFSFVHRLFTPKN
jgi:hypothetical protein